MKLSSGHLFFGAVANMLFGSIVMLSTMGIWRVVDVFDPVFVFAIAHYCIALGLMIWSVRMMRHEKG